MKDILIMGIESSCDETSVAIVKNSELSKLQKILWAGAALATYAAVVVILAILCTFGLIEAP